MTHLLVKKILQSQQGALDLISAMIVFIAKFLYEPLLHGKMAFGDFSGMRRSLR
jgi:hypothetical protein